MDANVRRTFKVAMANFSRLLLAALLIRSGCSSPSPGCQYTLPERLQLWASCHPCDEEAAFVHHSQGLEGEGEIDATKDNANDSGQANDVEPLQSFDEWTKKKLEEQKPAVSVELPLAAAPSATTLASRNYASNDCGAKILFTNPEAKNPSALLKDRDKDEYMLNPCQTDGPKVFVVELCETVQVSLVEIANFELFSSSPKEVRIFGNERYPSADWFLLGEWTASNKRDMQRFEVDSNLYTRYVKVELLSHYGTEHFCSLSVIRVLGISMVDAYEAEALSHDSLPAAPVDPPVTPTLATLDDNDSVSVDLLSSARNAVKSIARHVLEGANLMLNVVKAADEPSKSNASSCASWRDCCSSKELGPMQPISKFCYLWHLMAGQWSAKPVQPMMVVASPIYTGLPQPTTVVVSNTASMSNVDHCVAEVGTALQKWRRLIAERGQPDSTATAEVDGCGAGQRGNVTKGQLEKRKLLPPLKYSNESDPPPPSRTTTNVGPAERPLLSAASNSAKESVFLRLNSRIKQLEVNISLSSQYLGELSRNYKRQIEDIQRSLNRTVQLVSDSERRLVDMINAQSVLLGLFERRIDEMSAVLAVAKVDTYVSHEQWFYWHSGLFAMELCLAAGVIAFVLLSNDIQSQPRLRRSEIAKVVLEVLMSNVVKTPSDDRSQPPHSTTTTPASDIVESRRCLTVTSQPHHHHMVTPVRRPFQRPSSNRSPKMVQQRLRHFSTHQSDRELLNRLVRCGCVRPTTLLKASRCCYAGILFSSVPSKARRTDHIDNWLHYPGIDAASSPKTTHCSRTTAALPT